MLLKMINVLLLTVGLTVVQADETGYQFGQEGYEKEGVLDHRFVSVYPNSRLVDAKYESFEKLPLKVDNVLDTKSGKYWRYRVIINDENGRRDFLHTAEKIEQAFTAAVAEVKGTVYPQWGTGLVFNVEQPDGISTWGKLKAEDGLFELEVIDEDPLRQVLEFDVDLMKLQLDVLGKVTLEGIYFDLDKSTLKPESLPALEAAQALLSKYPELKLEIAGHTDSTGSDAYNMVLSQERAASVVAWLMEHGIGMSRLKASGYGETKPIRTNETVEGRAKNRRVELVDISEKREAGHDIIEMIKPFPNAVLLYEAAEEATETFDVDSSGEQPPVKITGIKVKRVYEVQNELKRRNKQVSGAAIKNNYLHAIEKVGGEILETEGDGMTFRFLYADGRITWGYLWAPNGRYTLILLTEPAEK